MQKIKAGVVGGAGYTGGELIRLLLNHSLVNIDFIHSRSNAGKPVSFIHQDLLGETDLVFASDISEDVDIVFLCLGHGESRKFLEATAFPSSVKIIDLSQDFRLRKDRSIGERKFVYGLPEINKQAISQAANIANPGCFATAIQLGLLPLAKAGLLKEVYATGITGSTGAGASLAASSHFSWRANNIQPYKVLSHQHLAEIGETMEQAGAAPSGINFVPWRGDFSRGILISSTVDCDPGLDEVNDIYKEFYKGAAYTFLKEKDIALKQVVNTNKCFIQIEKSGNKMVVHSIIDNLLKGASGQAVQNMNIMFGFNEKEGLQLKSIGF
jgi:N-acetyl-gamma-glutamyl-phosphate reductase